MSDEQERFLSGIWETNAALWVAAVRGKRIPSRIAGTDQAIVEAVRRHDPKSVLDMGCGEGWLVRRLTAEPGCRATGIDGSAALIAAARAADPAGCYRVLDYENIAAAPDRLPGSYDVAVFNFALLGREIAPLMGAVRQSLNPNGIVIIQTLHLWSVIDTAGGYADGWRTETFTALADGDWRPMPWYFRTLASWCDVIGVAGLSLMRFTEPADPETGKPLSMIFECTSPDHDRSHGVP